MQEQARQVRLFVRQHQQRFTKVTQVKRAGIVIETKRELLLTGPGSVFRLMFSRSDALGLAVPDFAHIVDYMISYRTNQSDTERAGGKVSRTLTSERTLLKDDAVGALTFLSSNLPYGHELDVDLLVKKWEKKHKLPVKANEAASKVLTRMRKMNSEKMVLNKFVSPTP